jgi:CRISPR-associated endonuclease Csy4
VNCEFLAGKCIRILHAFQSRFELRIIGVTFPEWSASSIGNSIAFVSESERSLAILRTQHYFTQMVEEGYFALSDTLLVPIKPSVPEVIYYRERRFEKETAAARQRELKRLQNRAAAREEEYTPQQTSSTQAEMPMAHQISFGSSSGHGFNLFIGRLVTDKPDSANFSSYGLGSRPEGRGSVPCLAPFIRTL